MAFDNKVHCILQYSKKQVSCLDLITHFLSIKKEKYQCIAGYIYYCHIKSNQIQ